MIKKVSAKYFNVHEKKWDQLEIIIDKKLNYDYSHCSWVAIDGEFLGLYPGRDKSVLWTIASEDRDHKMRVEMLYTADGDADFTLLSELLCDTKIEKIFWVGLVDIAYLIKDTGVVPQNIFDVRYASLIARTYTSDQSLDVMVSNFVQSGEQIFDKKQSGQSKEFGTPIEEWNDSLHQYNVNDVVYLKFLSDKIREIAKREGRTELLQNAFDALVNISQLYLAGFYRNIFVFGYKDTDMSGGTVIPTR